MVETIDILILTSSGYADDLTTGPVVRINPNELHFADFEFYDTIYASAPQKRDKWGYNAKAPDSHFATGFTLDHDLHKERRDAIAPFLSKRNIQAIEPEIQGRVDRVCQIIEEHHDSKKPVNLTVVILALSRLTSALSI
jgi:cytochrome P450